MMDESLSVRFRSLDDGKQAVTGGLMRILDDIAAPIFTDTPRVDVKLNPLAVTIRLGDMTQLDSVRWAAQEWIKEPLSPSETMERTVAIPTPGNNLIELVWVEEDDLYMVGVSLSAADCGGR